MRLGLIFGTGPGNVKPKRKKSFLWVGLRMSHLVCYTNHMMKMKNEEMELVNDNGTWKIKWNDGFERSFESFFKAKLHFVALVNQQIAMER